VVLNPVRALMVKDAAEWPWSNYRATIGQARPMKSLQVDWLLRQFGSDRAQAIVRYRNFVRAGIGLPPVWGELKHQIFLGEKAFVERLQSQIQTESGDLKEIPKVQRKPVGRPLSGYVEAFPDVKDGMRKAYESGDYTMRQIADAFGVHYSTVSRAVNKS
jgi:putative transposase